MRKILLLLFTMVLFVAVGCSDSNQTTNNKATSTIQKVVDKKKLVVGTAPGYLPFEMKDKQGNFIGYDIDMAKEIGKVLKVDVEFKQFEFSGLIPALQTGQIDLVVAGMTIRGDRALSVSFANPYYATGQVLMIPTKDNSTKSWKDLDQPGKQIAVSLGTTGALLAKQLFKNAKVVDFDDFPTAGMAMIQGKADGIVYDEPGVRTFEAMNKDSVKGVYDLISAENLGIAVQHNDLETVQWLNSFLESYRNSPTDIASKEKWFKSTDWMPNVAK